MKFEKFIPTDQLKPHIKYFEVSENELENENKVFPSSKVASNSGFDVI